MQKPHPPIIFGGDSLPALKRTADLGRWFGVRYTPDSLKPVVAQLKELTEKAGRDFTKLEISVGVEPGTPLNLDTAKHFADVGVHRLMTFAPGFLPRSRYDTDLYPKMEKFAEEVIAKA